MGRNIDDLVDDRARGLQSTGEKFHDAFLLQRPKNEWSTYIDETAKDICFGIQIGDLTLSRDDFGRELGSYYRRGLKQTVGRYADLPSVLDQHVSDEKLGLLAYQLNEFGHDIATNELGIDDVDKATEALVEKLLTRHVGSDLSVSFDLSGATVADITTQLFNNKTIASNVDLLLTEIEESASQGLLSLLDEPQMMTPLWDHQRDALQKWWKQDQCGYVDMATATGKTVLGLGAIALKYGELHPDDLAIGGLVSESETTGSDNILIVAHSDLILEQWRRAFEKHLNIPQERTTGSDDITLHWGTIHFRTPQSLLNDRQAGYDLVLLDEAHHYATGSEWGSLLDEFDGDILAMSGSVDDAGSDSKRIKDRLSNSVGPQIKRYTIAEARTDGVIPSFDWEVHYAPYDVVGDQLENIATRADQAFTDFQTRLSQGELTLDTDRRLKTYEDVRRFSHTKEGNHLKQQDEEFRDLVTRLFSRRTKKWNLSPVLDAVVDLVVEHHTTEQVVVLADSNAQVEELESRLNDVVANPASVYLVSGSQSRTEQRETIDKFDEPESSGVLLGTGDLLGEGVDMQHVSVAINMATGGVNQALVQRIGRVLRNPTDTPKHAMFYNIVGAPPTDSAAVHREDGKQLIEQAAGFCSLGRRFETLPGFAMSNSLDSSVLENVLDEGACFINTLEADGEYDWDNEIIKQDDLEALLDTVQSLDGDTETILGEWEEYAWKQSTDQLGTIEDPPTPIDSPNKETEQSDTLNDGSEISSADDAIPATKRSRIEDLVKLQPTDRSGLQIKWQLSSPREVENYLRSELSAYHFRDDADLVWASDKAETIVETLNKQTNGLSTSDLLEEIRRLNDKLGQVPTRAEIKSDGEYSLDHYEEAFDSWSAAVREAGFTPRGTVPKSDTPEYEAEDTAEGDGNPTSSQTVEPNPVSELYEAFRSLQTVLDAIIEYPESAVSASETSHPLVQYHSVIQAVVGTREYLPEGVDGLGGQQADRVPSKMTEYRAAYGTESPAYRTKNPVSGSKSWITAYQTIDVAPLADKTQEALEEHDIVEDASVFVRPVAPETEAPLPVLPWSYDELMHTLSLLSQFEARPKLPWDDDDQGKFPIEEVYERVCSVEEIDADHRVTLDIGAQDQLPTTTASSGMWSTTKETPKDRCGFMWPPNGSSSDRTQRASCCYRETWREFDRCIWHADTEIEKPVEELKDTRESESNRLHNHLPREILAGAILRTTPLTDEILTGVDFRGADFEGCEFTDAYLSYATFAGANLRATDFTETTVSRVDFRDADLTNATLTGLSLYDADFTGATLTDADFTGAKIEQATVTNAAIEDAVGVDNNDEDDVETESMPTEIGTPSNATDLTAGDDISLVVTTDTYIDRKNMGRITRQKDYLSVLAEITQHAVDTEADAVVHLGNLFWTTGSRDRASDELEEHLQTLAARDIDFLLVQAPRDSTANSTVLDSLEQRKLLTILDSGWHQFGSVGLLVHGVDAETIPDQTTTPPADTTTTVAALYDEITTTTTYSGASGLGTALESELDLILTGTPTVKDTTTESGTPLLSPGMPERIIGKSIIDSAPSTPGFLQCEIIDGEINTTRHETAARPAAGFRIELSADATKTDVIDSLPTELPTEAAVIFEVIGENSHESLSKKEIQEIINQRVEIVRGYDERTELNSHTATDGTNSTEETKTDATTPTVESIAAASSVFEVDSIKRKVDKLRSRGATREEALSCVSQYTRDRERDKGLYSVPGIGLTVGYKLSKHGVTSRDELTTEHLDIIKQIDGISDHHIEPIVEAVDGLEKPATTTTETQETDLAVTPNRLSEYYDSFQTVRAVVAAVLQVEGTGIAPDDLTHPAVQYYVLLDACLSYGLSELTFTGYGLQHQDRLSISIDEYRDAYGDSDTMQVINHQKIPVERYTDDTQSWLANNTWLTDTDQLARPIAPESEYPLPEMVTTKQELLSAVELLNEFPAYPSIPGEMDTRNRTIPIKTLYQDLFSEVDDEHLIDLSLLSPPGQASGEPVTGPVAEATPTSQADANSTLLDYGKLSHLFKRVTPPSDSPIQRQLPVFGLDWYRQQSPSFTALQNLAKYDDNDPITHFEPRLQDMVNRRFLRDRWNYDYITVFPSHEKETLSPSLVDLAQEAVVETSMVYTPLLERTETTDRQREKSETGRKQVAIDPEETLRARAALNGKTVVLLDDICTTGSSLLAGAYLLREAGASRVVGVTLGFTPGGPADNVSVIEKPDAYASEIIAGVE